ncbi:MULTISPECIES: hypothetical protein [Mesonia]|uniref:Uncharacterized protein n=1 Tax=Mesonia oceanica TaxID=2687242 RepID=A0AC61Y9M7_9FLAO|nr:MULTISPECIES: hypothetical protein [Mesonia]MAN27817.1 hypothetical protein [Mesonia sp.]MAQ40997.1 hypothetical protein [Mesonia sp.]MBJ96463.1 hypothetical protein [Flavobacteriaceae bacterium]VVV01089.1 hypothetical protein FVB9532_02368 [Mesonia oceanica]|tara:strand:- start:81633 stop:82073 length:441 start_codon:yes stop_codon:yes gene_type:complete
MKKTLVFIFAGILLVSCGEKQKASKEKQHYDESIDEILVVHDEVMPKMGALSSLIEKTETKIDTTEIGKEFENVNQELKQAHELMMTWMKDFGEKFPNALVDTTYSKEEYEKREPILSAEKEEVKEMKDRVNKSIEKAQELLTKTS